MKETLKAILWAFASLKLTVALLALSMVLIFAGTTVQAEMGIWDVQRFYFHSWFCFIEWRLFFPLWEWGNKTIPGAIPFPGGYTLIVLLLINLVAAHTLRFAISWKRSGILLIHGGMILLLVGEVITSQYAVESQMVLDVGGSANYTSDTRSVELAITDRSGAEQDEEIVISDRRLLRKGVVQHPKLPFAVKIDEFWPNSTILGPAQAGSKKDARATAGDGVGLTAVPLARFSGTEANKVDAPSAYVTLQANGESLGTYLASLFFDHPQAVKVGDKEYWLQLRFRRFYKPYTFHLAKFSHDRYTGTNVAKNFSSLVRVVDPARSVDREVLIWMNHPLRYAGETFYQASFKPGDQTSILQVVRNPGWLLPYISCTLVGLGMLVHFGMHLVKFLRRGVAPAPAQVTGRRPRAVPVAQGSWVPAALIAGFCCVYLLSLLRAPEQKSPYDLKTFASLPVSHDGRTMPLDSLARNSLRILSGRSDFRYSDGKRPAIEWLIDVFAEPERATNHKVFRIDHPDILSLLELDEKQKLFSINELAGEQNQKIAKLQDQYSMATQVDSKKRDLYQRKVVELGERVLLFNRLSNISSLFLSPPIGHDDWRSFGEAMDAVQKQGKRDPGAESFLAMIQAHHENRPDQFNALASEYRSLLDKELPKVTRKLDVEVLFNRTAPFIQCMVLYVIVFVLAALSWLKWGGALSKAALWVLVIALVFHTLGLVTRVYLQGRPPVTNLYSSAVFIAWAAVAICVGLEIIYRNGLASAAASAIAFPSLLIAHYLAGDGDTMRMLQAVLDTNIWLATHVVVITLGYAATFLAGFIAIGYVLGSLFTRAIIDDVGRAISRMIYGVICFAMLLSFVGTILGGIWADQSWGRFWGWDPKENGAVLIVLWNAIILHARWGGIVRQRGVALMAIFGNIVTAWSWFGTNMLGVGLHSYGFMDSAMFWLATFAGSQLLLILAGAWIDTGAKRLIPEPVGVAG